MPIHSPSGGSSPQTLLYLHAGIENAWKEDSYPDYQKGCQEKKWWSTLINVLWILMVREGQSPRANMSFLCTSSPIFPGSTVLQALRFQRTCLHGRCSATFTNLPVRTYLMTSSAWFLSCILVTVSNSVLWFLRQSLLADVKFHSDRFCNIWSSFYQVALFFSVSCTYCHPSAETWFIWIRVQVIL